VTDSFRWRVVPIFAAFLGCRSAPPPAPPAPCAVSGQIEVVATERVNPDFDGSALPTVVRIFQLKQSVRLEEAEFSELWEKPVETLGEELIQKQEFTLFPGTSHWVDASFVPEARYVVAMGVFRQPTGVQWRSVVPLPPSERLCAAYKAAGAPSPAIRFELDGYRLEGKMSLLRNGGQLDLPGDVAPGSAGVNDESARRAQPPDMNSTSGGSLPGGNLPSVPSASSTPSMPSSPSIPSSSSMPSAPSAPSSPSLPQFGN
jgi:type VI secretion system protein VasD